ncbi:MAG: ATP-binding protein [Deltaproteobacteria bacterium]|nr:ATP-binding protein [Candidatus Anaeroferrophillus wilburensis]MBN2888701.1 ATP-binding protein [Deltaproteobacteria bacterium]
MKELTIVSGKGGTGKTTVTAAFASLIERKLMTDCDVDAADLHLILIPEVYHEEDFVGGRAPTMDKSLCTECGTCQEVCRFAAITHDVERGYRINSFACDNCALCSFACPEGAITMVDSVNGTWYISRTPYGKMVHAKLGIGEDNSGKLVTLVRQQAKKLAQEEGLSLIVSDGPPGIGCPVTAAITGTTLVLIVTEPTISGIHDMERVADLCRHFQVPVQVCINKYSINLVNTQKIRHYCADRGIPVVGEIPFEPLVNKAQVARKSVVDFDCGSVGQVVRQMWQEVEKKLLA